MALLLLLKDTTHATASFLSYYDPLHQQKKDSELMILIISFDQTLLNIVCVQYPNAFVE